MVSVHQDTLVFALDAMGGDHAPYSVVAGIDKVCISYPSVRFLLYGDKDAIDAVLKEFPRARAISTVLHTEVVVSSEDKPSTALRQGKNSSMRLAIDAVKEGKAVAVVSAGNTGALMAMAKIVLKTLPGIDRPAIGTMVPTLKGASVMLDLGANAECTPDNLFQFAVMGNAFARVVLKRESPSIGLLNIGSEEVKGNETVRAAATLLKNSQLPLRFTGFIEGNDIAEGTVDVVVTDGFSGNIALKTAEGTAKICRDFLKQAFSSSLLAKLGFVLARSALKKLFSRIDHRLYNGAMFLGLNGIVVKSHGSTDAFGFSKALEVAIMLSEQGINEKITQEVMLAQAHGNTEAATVQQSL